MSKLNENIKNIADNLNLIYTKLSSIEEKQKLLEEKYEKLKSNESQSCIEDQLDNLSEKQTQIEQNINTIKNKIENENDTSDEDDNIFIIQQKVKQLSSIIYKVYSELHKKIDDNGNHLIECLSNVSVDINKFKTMFNDSNMSTNSINAKMDYLTSVLVKSITKNENSNSVNMKILHSICECIKMSEHISY